MPAPTSALSTLRPDLGGSFFEFDDDAAKYGAIAIQIAKPIESAKSSGQFGRVTVEAVLQDVETLRAPGAGYSRRKTRFAPDTFATVEHGVEEPIDDREVAMYREYITAELEAAKRARADVIKSLEKRMADLIFNTTTWTGAALTTSVTNEWDDNANATPVDDINAAKLKVFENSGLIANALVIGWTVFQNLRDVRTSNQIVDRLKYCGLYDPSQRRITTEVLAQVFDLDYVIVGGKVRNSAKEGQSATIAQIWDDEYAMVCRVAETESIKEPCIARIIHWAEDGSEIGGAVETYRDEPVRSDIVRCRMDTDEKVMLTEAGHLLQNITS